MILNSLVAGIGTGSQIMLVAETIHTERQSSPSTRATAKKIT